MRLIPPPPAPEFPGDREKPRDQETLEGGPSGQSLPLKEAQAGHLPLGFWGTATLTMAPSCVETLVWVYK